MATPSADDLRAFVEGRLDAARFREVDAWMQTQDEPTVAAALAEIDRAQPVIAGIAESTAGFQSEGAASRQRIGAVIGAGGMSEVLAAHDLALHRDSALKVLRPRGADEALEQYLLRVEAFRREAAITAALEHPAIVPVHDVGSYDGRPAFTMRRIAGTTLHDVIAHGDTALPALVTIVLRVAEALAFAHSRGYVHRDVTPSNVLIGAFGEVYVLDWGLAATIGSTSGLRVGTPGWMAPEQELDVAVDPRMDVYALGGLLGVAITGRHVRQESILAHAVQRAMDLPGVPSGLAAVVRRCVQRDPAQRYADAQAVVDELRRWQDHGVTMAQQAGTAARLWIAVTRTPARRRSAVAAMLAVLLLLGAGWWWSAHAAAALQAQVMQLATIPHDADLSTLGAARDQIERIRKQHPQLIEAEQVAARLTARLADVLARIETQRIEQRFDALLNRTRVLGPWADQERDWSAALAQAGLDVSLHGVSDERMLLSRDAPAMRQRIASALVFLWRGQRERGATQAAAITARLLKTHGPSAGWRGLGDVLDNAGFRAHDPVLCHCPGADAMIDDAQATATALAIFAPDPRLNAWAEQRLRSAPTDFWPLIAVARAAIDRGDTARAQRLADVASGVEPHSILPKTLAGYVAMADQRWDELDTLSRSGLAVDPRNQELLAMQAVALVKTGRSASAQAVIDALSPSHLRFHIVQRVGHPMERSVALLQAAGLHFHEAPAQLGPLSPLP